MPLPHPNPSLRRNREENWSDEEKKALLALVKTVILVIEDKSTESNTNKKKHLTWKDIAEKFHMMTGKNRPVNKIMEQWKRMKAQSKKNVAAFEKARRATGGGQNKVKVTDMDWAVKELVPQYFFHDTNPFDDDGYENHSDIDTATQQSPSLLRNFEQSESQPQTADLEIVSMDVAPATRERNPDTCSTYAGSQLSPPLHQHIEPSVIVQEFDVVQTDRCYSPISPFREITETPRHRIQQIPVATREISRNQNRQVADDSPPRDASASRTRVQQIPVATREISRNQNRQVADDSPPRDASASRTRVQRKRKFNEAEYHKLLIKKKEEEYNGKARQRDELHQLELKQRGELHELEIKKKQIEIEILELTKQKLQKELRLNIN